MHPPRYYFYDIGVDATSVLKAASVVDVAQVRGHSCEEGGLMWRG